ncbi:MAG TPA: LLM class flavin-dependent oxidoreductase [Dehalococcoidia bacterium]|nr:LLM class flavin-dependent oxidoreductase [Dehalococcoidia bacterium]
MIRFGLLYDFRNPARWRVPNARLYAQTLEQIVFAEQLGYDSVWISEHHFVEDGYTPSVLALAAHVAARTARVRIGTSVLLLPFHDPLRVAEDANTVDVLSGGRLDLGIGLGYRAEEFEAFGFPRRQRPSRFEEHLAILRRALSGEPFTFAGRYRRIERPIAVTPRGVQQPSVAIWCAASSIVAAQRAARERLNLTIRGGTDVYNAWAEGLRAQGEDASQFQCVTRRSYYVTDDPERAWSEIGPHVRYQTEAYAEWGAAGQRETVEPEAEGDRRARQTWMIGDPEAVAAMIREYHRRLPFTQLIGFGVPPGLPPERMNAALERFAREVMPRLRDLDATPAAQPRS